MRYRAVHTLLAVGLITGCADDAPQSDAGAPVVDAGFVMDAGRVEDGGVVADAGAPFGGTLASGTFALPAANAFGDPGFHEVLSTNGVLPNDLGSTAGQLLIVRLWDQSRPMQTCAQDHPTSGCATVDWSDFEGRPNVPQGGVFDNRLTVQLASGARDYFLSEEIRLNDIPDPYVPS